MTLSYTRVHVQLRITGYRYAHAFPLREAYTTKTAPLSAATQRLEAEPCVTNYAWYVQEVADKPHSPRIESGRGHDHSKAGPICCSYRRSYGLMFVYLLFYPFGLGCVCEKAQQTFGGSWQTTTARSSKKKAGPGTSNGRLPRSPVEDKAFLW